MYIQRSANDQRGYRYLMENSIELVKISPTSKTALAQCWLPITAHHSTSWLYCVEFPQYSIRIEALGYLCTSCLLPAFDET